MTKFINSIGLSTNGLSYSNISNLNSNFMLEQQITKDNLKRKIFSAYNLREVNRIVFDSKDLLQRSSEYVSKYQDVSQKSLTNSEIISFSIKNHTPIKTLKSYYVDPADLTKKEVFKTIAKFGREQELESFSWKREDVEILLEIWKWFYQNTVNFSVELPTSGDIDFLSFLDLRGEVLGLPTEIIEKPTNGVIIVKGVGVWQ